MSTEKWLPLTEYSNKYKVSISTLRRRLKAGQVRYKYQEGKYNLLDIPLQEHDGLTTQAPIQTPAQRPLTTIQPPLVNSQNRNRVTTAPPQQVTGHPAPLVTTPSASGELGQLEASIQKILSELKKAYTMVLQEKEEQIILLKEEVTDLRTLVQVLESENDRLKVNARDAAPIDSWLNDIDALEK